MAEETLEEEYNEDDQDESEDSEDRSERQKRGFLAYFDLQRLLLLSLQYLVIIILTFGIAYWVSSRNSSKTQIEGSAIMPGPGSSASIDVETGDLYTPVPSGFDWTMDEMIINTSDVDVGHYVKATIVVSYDKDKPAVLTELTRRSSQIHAEVRKIIGSKTYAQLQGIPNQELLTKEIKTRIQLITGKPGLIDVFLRDFTLH